MQDGIKLDRRTFERIYGCDLICILVLTALVVLVFSGTIFAGEDITRIGTVAHRDTLFGRFAKGSPDPMDTSVYQEHAPSYLLAEKIIASGNLPLWNPYLGLGCPLWADPQVLAFSPITWLQAPFASLRLYNLLEVFHVWLCCLVVYIFARLLRLSAPASLLSSIAYSFCPNTLYMFEWNRFHSGVFALPFLGFAYLWRRGNSLSVVVCALLCAALVVSGHASPTFFSIVPASCMYLALAYRLPQNLSGEGAGRFSSVPVRNFLVTGVLTFLLSAPIVVPFLEVLRASDCFKASQINLRYIVRGTALLPSLFYPFHGPGSVYPGPVSILLAVSAYLISLKNRALIGVISVLAVLTYCMMTRMGPFDLFFQIPYLSWQMVTYATPALILFVALLAGLGYDALLDEQSTIRSVIIVAAVAILPLSMPFIFQNMHLSSEYMRLNDWVTTMSISSSVRLRELSFLIITLAVVIAMAKAPAQWRKYLAVSLIVLNVTSRSFLIRKSMPSRPPFSYEEVEPIGFLKSQNRRVVSMGRHVLVPNTSQIFAVANLVSFLPTHPAGVLAYLKALDITIEGVGQYAEKPLTKLIDAASVKYAVASEPVLFSEDKLPEPADISATGVGYGADVQLKACALDIDASNQDIIGSLKWMKAKGKNALFYVAMVVREDGGLVWIGDRHPIGDLSGSAVDSQGTVNSIVTAIIPRSLKVGESVCMILQVIDSESGQLVEPKNVPPAMRIGGVAKSLLLKRFIVPAQPLSAQASMRRHFKLVNETAPEMVRVYENTGCLPEAFLVSKIRQVKDIQESINEMAKPGFSPRAEALISGQAPILIQQAEPGSNGEEPEEVKVSRPTVNEVTIELEARKPSVLILTDVFFPGWHCKVDGKDADIYRANAVFRAVKVETGRHKVRFFYDPYGLKIGLLLFALGLAASVCLLRFGMQSKALKEG